MNDVKDFLARHPVRKGKLAAWQADIVALRSAGISYRQICCYLAEHGVTAGPQEVRRFLLRCGRQKLIKTPGPSPSRAIQPPSPDSGTTPGMLPKFEWKPGKPETPW